MSTGSKGLVIHGIIGAETIDSSGEQLVVKGCDISSMEKDGILNWEHIGEEGGASAIIGKCIKCKKIYGPEDCDNASERKFWNEVKVPLIYAQFRLFDAQDDHTQAKAAAAFIRDQRDNSEPLTLRFSLEGNTLHMTDDKRITDSICRRCALTTKPCNKAATSEILRDPKTEDSELSFGVIKFEHPSYQRLVGGGSPLVVDDVTETFLENAHKVIALAKSLEAGNYNAAPSTLTGGAALQREDLGEEHRKRLAAICKAAIRDHDPSAHGPFRPYLKSLLPEACDEFLDRFTDLAEELNTDKLKANYLKKSQQVESDCQKTLKILAKGESSSSENKTVMHQGSAVQPGEIEIISGPNAGKMPLVSIGADYHHVLDDGKLSRIKANHPNTRITKEPTVVRASTMVDSKKHGHPYLHNTFEQHDLIHGLDMAKRVGQVGLGRTKDLPGGENTGWYRSGEGHLAFVKPNVGSKSNAISDLIFGPAHREAAFHRLANDFFGLGENVPVTTIFKHPVTGEWHSAQQKVEGEHLSPTSMFHKESLGQMARSGTLDKIALMDMILGQADRHGENGLISHDGHTLHLIDNGLSFPKHTPDSHKQGPLASEFWTTGNRYNDGPQWYTKPLHSEAAKWVESLDPKDLSEQMVGLNMPKSEQDEAIRRLSALKARVAQGNVSRGAAYSAPFIGHRYKPQGESTVNLYQALGLAR